MESTEKLFYSDTGLFEAEARVVEALRPEDLGPEAWALVLDRTVFYPEGGGQPCDLGTIGPLAGGPAVAVASVREEGAAPRGPRILHFVAGDPGLRPGDRVRLSVDRRRRIDYSQQHSAQHLLSALALRLLGAPTVSVHFGSERSLVDFDLPSIAESDLERLEDAVEAAIAEGHPIRTHLCPPEDPSSLPLRRPPPAGEEQLRVVEVEGIDFAACCGLHLDSTAALRLVRLLGAERYKGMTRIYFVAGARAAADYRGLLRGAQAAARSLGSSVSDLAAAASRSAERSDALERRAALLERGAAELEASTAPERPSAGGAGLALRRYADRGADSLMTGAKAFSEAGMTALLASLPDLTVQALTPRRDLELGGILRPLLAAAGGKGGGGQASFRAAFADPAALEGFLAAASEALAAHGASG